MNYYVRVSSKLQVEDRTPGMNTVTVRTSLELDPGQEACSYLFLPREDGTRMVDSTVRKKRDKIILETSKSIPGNKKKKRKVNIFLVSSVPILR